MPDIPLPRPRPQGPFAVPSLSYQDMYDPPLTESEMLDLLGSARGENEPGRLDPRILQQPWRGPPPPPLFPRGNTLRSLGEMSNLQVEGDGIPRVSGGVTLPGLGETQLRGMYQRNPYGRSDWMLGLEGRF